MSLNETITRHETNNETNKNSKKKNEAKPCQKKQALQKDFDKIAPSRPIILRGGISHPEVWANMNGHHKRKRAKIKNEKNHISFIKWCGRVPLRGGGATPILRNKTLILGWRREGSGRVWECGMNLSSPTGGRGEANSLATL